MKSSPNLLVVASTYPRWINDSEPGFIHELSRRLVGSYNVHVISPHAPGALIEECIDGVYIHRFRYAPSFMESLVHDGGILANLKRDKWKWLLLPFFFLGMQIKIFKIVLKIKPVCIHVHWIILQGLCIALLACFMKLPPIILTSHGGDLFSLKGSIFTRLKRWVLSKVSMVTVVSNIMEPEIIKLGFSRERVVVIPMGADFNSRFTPGESKTRDPNELLFVGRLVEKKGVNLLIQALEIVVEKIPAVRLTIAGYGPELPGLKKMTQDLMIENKIEFLGAVQQADLAHLYRRCAIFVAPFIKAKSGDQEGFPVSIIEAVACETPLLTSKLPVLVDAFGDYAAHLTCDVENSRAFGEKIIQAIENPITNAAAVFHLRKTFIKELDWMEIAKRYRTLIDKLCINDHW